MELNPKQDDYYERVDAYISADPALAARVLQFANSTAVGAARPATTLRAALMLVGAAGAVNYVVARSAINVFIPRASWQRDLWHHALNVAALCRQFAEEFAPGIPSEQAYLAGLLHDVGRLILYLEAPEQLREVEETDWASPEALVEAEKSVCGFTHTELGYLAACKWRLPTSLAALIRTHHAVEMHATGIAREGLPLWRILRFSDWVAISAHRTSAPGDLELLVNTALKMPGCPSHDQACILQAIQKGMAEGEAAQLLVGL